MISQLVISQYVLSETFLNSEAFCGIYNIFVCFFFTEDQVIVAF